MSALLSIDFDFFFPEPWGAGKTDDPGLLLWDWNHSEHNSNSVADVLWTIRAASFIRHGVPLPKCTGYEGWWDQFDLTDVQHLFVSDSHALAVDDRVQATYYDWVVNFDAHHDAGYSRDWRKDNMIQCDNWMQLYEQSALLTVVYPDWKVKAFDIEPKPICKQVGRVWDRDFMTNRKNMDVANVLLCRSGAWVPSWCDDQFDEFLAAFPYQDRIVMLDREGWTLPTNRGFDEVAINDWVAAEDEMRKQLEVQVGHAS